MSDSPPEQAEPVAGWARWWSTPHPGAVFTDRGREQFPVAMFVLTLGFGAYVGFIPMFLAFGIYETATENLVVSIGFAVALWATRRGYLTSAIAFGVIAVVAHATANSMRLGWSAGFHYQILLGALVQGLVAPVSLPVRTVTAIACAVAYMGLAALTYGSDSAVITAEQRQMFATMNVATFALVLALIGLYYSEQVYRNRRERDAAQEALGAALRNSRAIVDHMADGLLALDHAGRVRARNGSLDQLLGDEAIPDGLVALAREAGEAGEVLRGEVALPGGRVAAVVASPIDDGGVVALVRDITREKEVDRMKTEFTAMVSHELRTPLTSLMGFTRMIQTRFEDRVLPKTAVDDARTERAVRQVRENLQIMLKEGNRLAELINNVLDIAKMEAGSMAFEEQPVDVEAVVRQAEAASSGLFLDRPVQLVVAIDGPLPELVGDAGRLQQVLVNLVSNASKFTTEGEVRIEASAREGGVEIRVVDTGPGIPESEHEAIFDRFHQVGGGLGDRPKGTGLGLPICRHIVESHGGTIHVESVMGEGATMVVRLGGRP